MSTPLQIPSSAYSDGLWDLCSNCVNLIFTSPPPATRSAPEGEGISPDHYVEWFLPIGEELLRVLSPRGSLILNAGGMVEKGEPGTCVMELIAEMEKLGWLLMEEYVWHEMNWSPGEGPIRSSDTQDWLLHFTKSRMYDMYRKRVVSPVGGWSSGEPGSPVDPYGTRKEPRGKGSLGKNIRSAAAPGSPSPARVPSVVVEYREGKHPQDRAESLPSWFIKLFTKKGDLVLDPFAGDFITLLAAQKLRRQVIGVEIMTQYRKAHKRKALKK